MAQHTPARNELGAFLRSRRDRLLVEDVRLQFFGRRRVQGLRREELAQLAGVSVNYLTRLEQGQSRNVSEEIIDALSRAFWLNPDERAHAHALAHRDPVLAASGSVPEEVPGASRSS